MSAQVQVSECVCVCVCVSIKGGGPRNALGHRPEPEVLPLPAETSREAPKCCAWQHQGGGGPETRSGTVQSLKCCPCQQKRGARLPSAVDGARARFGAPPPLMLPGAALGSLAPRFCWQGQHLRLWTVPERVSGPPPLDAARRSTWEPRASFLLAGAALEALDGARARFGAPPP